MEAKLAVLKNVLKQEDVIITAVPYKVGRSRSANLIIPHTNVSRQHCQIVNDNGSWKIYDCSSSGTFVNDLLIGKGKSEVISSGDTIRLGLVENDLCWTFILLPNESGVENYRPKAQVLVNVKSDAERLGEKCFEREMQHLKKNIVEVKTKEMDAESEVKEALCVKGDGEKIQELQRELQQMKNTLNDIEEQNNVLQEKLATELKNKTANLKAEILENITDLMETEMQCTICSELFVTAVTLSCSHTFCKYCVDQWKKKQKTCPICRKKISKETRSLVVDNYIDKMIANFSVEWKERREMIIQERKEEPIKKRKCIY